MYNKKNQNDSGYQCKLYNLKYVNISPQKDIYTKAMKRIYKQVFYQKKTSTVSFFQVFYQIVQWQLLHFS